MSRRTTILIAVLMNVALLAILFATAVNYDPSTASSSLVANKSTMDANSNPNMIPQSSWVLQTTPTDVAKSPSSNSFPIADEVDKALHSYQPLLNLHNNPFLQETPEATQPIQEAYVEVKINHGDTLAKIARMNGVTVQEIKKLNELTTDQLTVGKFIKIPLSHRNLQPAENIKKEAPTAQEKPKVSQNVSPVTQSKDVQYYIVKPGDNPWLIAHKHKIKLEEFLRLNQLDQEKARHLKPGDKLRVR